MDISIFSDRAKMPGEANVKKALGKTYLLWQKVCGLAGEKIPAIVYEWNFPGEKYGWSLKIKKSKRVIFYMLPREESFMVAFVFGDKAFNQVMMSSVSAEIKKTMEAAKVYGEGRGIRIPVTSIGILEDINRLIDIKLAF